MTKPGSKDIEFHSDAWERFERAAGVVTKAPPQHRVTKKAMSKKRIGKKKTAKQAKAKS